MTYPEAIQFLYGLQLFGLKLGLENPRRLAALAGNPQEKLRFVHVAGTNGKGSTCAMLESIYRASGLCVGLFTSPHLIAFGERIQVNRQLIPEAEVVRLVSELQPLLKQFPADHHPTFFEVVTVMALRYFAEQRCDLVIWETGMGGRLDATNIVTPLASVITNIAFDHEKWLGETLPKIAAEKAGIIKPRVPVITGADGSDALDVISEAARQCDAPLTIVSANDVRRSTFGLQLSLLGEHQRRNAALAITVVQALQNTLSVSAENLRHGLETVRWAGRLQVIQRRAQTLLLDGAHNPAGAVSLRDTLAKEFSGRKPVLVLGVLADKACTQICAVLASLVSRAFLVPVTSQRTAQPLDLQRAFQTANPQAQATVCSSLAEALERTRAEDFVVITGSLYLVGEALELLGAEAESRRSERSLNEWRENPR